MQRGTKHKPESVVAIGTKMKAAWERIPAAQRSEIMKARVAARTRNKSTTYGDN